ncbi:MAG TPA: CatB-related O-acetyltransferase, partial [Arenibaculum sp.]|nr:CatB-related O-acetyltransferase [Arenibaculum sp.]
NPHAKLAGIGLKLPMMRGVFALRDTSFFEPPTMVQAAITSGTFLQVGAFCSVAGGRIGNLRMGRYCSIAPDVIIGSNEHPADWLTSSRVTHVADLHNWARFMAPDRVDEIREQRRPFMNACRQTKIGNDVWVGQGVFIKAGVSIGDGAIVGARSVVVKDVPPYAIVAGVPARVIKYRFPENAIERLTKVQWWRYSIFDFFGIPFERIDEALDLIEARIAEGAIREYKPERITPNHLAELLTPADALQPA